MYMETIKLSRTQLAALRLAQRDEAHSRAILESLDQTTDPEERQADAAHALRLLDDALTIRETIGFVDPYVYSPVAAQRAQAATDPRATSATWRILSDDRSPAVRDAVILGRAAREARFPPPGSAAESDFEHVDPLTLISAWVGGASSNRRDTD